MSRKTYVYAIDSTVFNPASTIVLISRALIPFPYAVERPGLAKGKCRLDATRKRRGGTYLKGTERGRSAWPSVLRAAILIALGAFGPVFSAHNVFRGIVCSGCGRCRWWSKESWRLELWGNLRGGEVVSTRTPRKLFNATSRAKM